MGDGDGWGGGVVQGDSPSAVKNAQVHPQKLVPSATKFLFPLHRSLFPHLLLPEMVKKITLLENPGIRQQSMN